jgi:transposase
VSHLTVPRPGEYERDRDGHGLCEVYVGSVGSFWSLSRSRPRAYRGIAQGKLPLYLDFFQFMHNAPRRGTGPT